MSSALDPLITEHSHVVDRLLTAGILAVQDDSLATTERWQDGLLRELMARPEDGLRSTFARTIGHAFPDAPEDDRDVMARIMLHVEAREASAD